MSKSFKTKGKDDSTNLAEVSDAIDRDSVDLSEDLSQTPTETLSEQETPTESLSERSESGVRSLPAAATAPASMSSPASAPKAAAATPASSPHVRRSTGPIDFFARAQPDPFGIPNDPASFKGFSEEKVAEMTRIVPCQFIGDLTGKINLRCSFSYRKGQIFMLPKWFAATYPNSIVIKE